MSKKGEGKTNGTANARSFKMDWINYTLTQQDKERLQDKSLVDELLRFSVDDLVFEGFKFSLSRDEKNSCFVASLTIREGDSSSPSRCLTGRGATPADARVSLLYRHLVLAQGDWSFFSQNPMGSDDLYF